MGGTPTPAPAGTPQTPDAGGNQGEGQPGQGGGTPSA
jgi:hypothetical protein